MLALAGIETIPGSGGCERAADRLHCRTPTVNNRIGLTAHNRVIVTVSSSGYTPASIDVQLLGTAVGTDRERISMVAGTTYQINSWVTGNGNTAVTYTMSPTVSGGSVSRKRSNHCAVLRTGRDQNYGYDHECCRQYRKCLR